MTTPTTPHPIDEQIERAVEKQLDNVRWLLNGLTVIGAFDPVTKDEIRKCIAAAIRSVVESLQQQLVDEAKRAEQLATNCRWLIDRVDRIHRELCPDDIGTWQERVEQAVSASAKLRQQLAAREAEIERAVLAEREACAKVVEQTAVVIESRQVNFGYVTRTQSVGDTKLTLMNAAQNIRARITPKEQQP